MKIVILLISLILKSLVERKYREDFIFKIFGSPNTKNNNNNNSAEGPDAQKICLSSAEWKKVAFSVIENKTDLLSLYKNSSKFKKMISILLEPHHNAILKRLLTKENDEDIMAAMRKKREKY